MAGLAPLPLFIQRSTQSRPGSDDVSDETEGGLGFHVSIICVRIFRLATSYYSELANMQYPLINRTTAAGNLVLCSPLSLKKEREAGAWIGGGFSKEARRVGTGRLWGVHCRDASKSLLTWPRPKSQLSQRPAVSRMGLNTGPGLLANEQVPRRRRPSMECMAGEASRPYVPVDSPPLGPPTRWMRTQ